MYRNYIISYKCYKNFVMIQVSKGSVIIDFEVMRLWWKEGEIYRAGKGRHSFPQGEGRTRIVTARATNTLDLNQEM